MPCYGRAGFASPQGAACLQQMQMEKHDGCDHHARSKPSLGLLAPPETGPRAARLLRAQPGRCPAPGGLHGLVMFCHGQELRPPAAHEQPAPTLRAPAAAQARSLPFSSRLPSVSPISTGAGCPTYRKGVRDLSRLSCPYSV